MNITEFDGQVFIGENRVLFRYKEHRFTLFSTTIGAIPIFVVGEVFDGPAKGHVLFRLSHPFGSQESVFPRNIIVNVDYYVLKYDQRSQNSSLRFSLPELNQFIPSWPLVQYSFDNPHDPILLAKEEKEIKSFDIDFKGRPIHISFKITPEMHIGKTAELSTKTTLEINFEKNADYDFIYDLYHLVQGLFSFIYNRRNLWFTSISINGSYSQKSLPKERLVSALFFSNDRHMLPPENQETISKEKATFSLYEQNINALMQMIADDKLNYMNTHASTLRRNLVDLTQYLNITSSFELYHRELCPKDTSNSSDQLYEEVRELVRGFAEKQTGKRKEKAKKIAKEIRNENSLGQRIENVFNGYHFDSEKWEPLFSIFPHITPGRCKVLATVANRWRNELAHAKREEEPEADVIDAIRFVEQLNYVIVLRSAGYDDVNIMHIIAQMPAIS